MFHRRGAAVVSLRVPSYHVRTTTILCLRNANEVVLAGDGQLTEGRAYVGKSNVVKVRRIRGEGSRWDVLVGFAGSTTDCITLVDLLEQKINAHPQHLAKACVEVAKGWRTNKMYRNLEASLLVADRTRTFSLRGDGNVIEPQDGFAGIGSGGPLAVAAARAILHHYKQPQHNTAADGKTTLNLLKVAQVAMEVATDMDLYSNSNHVFEVLEIEPSTTTVPSSSTSKNNNSNLPPAAVTPTVTPTAPAKLVKM